MMLQSDDAWFSGALLRVRREGAQEPHAGEERRELGELAVPGGRRPGRQEHLLRQPRQVRAHVPGAQLLTQVTRQMPTSQRCAMWELHVPTMSSRACLQCKFPVQQPRVHVLVLRVGEGVARQLDRGSAAGSAGGRLRHSPLAGMLLTSPLWLHRICCLSLAQCCLNSPCSSGTCGVRQHDLAVTSYVTCQVHMNLQQSTDPLSQP